MNKANFSARQLTRDGGEVQLNHKQAAYISDGEKRKIPVYRRGTEMVNGTLLLLEETQNQLPDSLFHPERGPVHLQISGNRLQQIFNDLDHIIDYPSACTEQTASRLIGLLCLQKIQAARGKTFSQEKDILKMIKQLQKLQQENGGYGWWPDATEPSYWISQQVYRALTLAQRADYAVGNLDNLQRFLLAGLQDLPYRDRLQAQLLLAESGRPISDSELAKLDAPFIKTDASIADYELLALTRLHQLRGDTINIQRVVDSSDLHFAGGRYWGAKRYAFFRQPLDDRLACGLLAQQILRGAGLNEEADEAINYLLGQTPTPHGGNRPLLGTNTLASARLVESLLPVLLKELDTLRRPQVTLSTHTGKQDISIFPYETSITQDQMSSLRISREGSGPLPVAIYQRWFERQPSAQNTGFNLSSEFRNQQGQKIDRLIRGENVFLEVTLTAQADGEYVLLEIPIPAGCSYTNRREQPGPFAVHREYRRDRIAIFCDRLPAGTHTYKIELTPKFSGAYTLNPARAEMQYLPVKNGNGSLRQIEIIKK